MGAAGRDFHNFNVFFKDNSCYEVMAFTAAQIPNIDGRKYKGIPIYPEKALAGLILKKGIEQVFFSYSDISYKDLMQKAAVVMAAGASFCLLGKNETMLKAKKPMIAITAVRTGCGKSAVSQAVAGFLASKGLQVGIVRHPMPYGDLTKQICQKFEKLSDLDKHKCTIEEREEYEPYLERGLAIYAGVDYKKILDRLEKESDVILWDGGNNDFPFYKPDLYIVLTDAYRPGHETAYYPGEINFRSADVIIVSKVNTAVRRNVKIILENAKKLNPEARVILIASSMAIDRPDLVKGKSVLVVEDGPSVTHGELPYGAGFEVALEYRAKKIVDPRPFAAGSIKATFKKYSHVERVLPAMGYDKKQRKELETTINRIPCDSVILATPARLEKFLKINKPLVRVRYSFKEIGKPTISEVLNKFLKKYV